jgi:hypothetical protein
VTPALSPVPTKAPAGILPLFGLVIAILFLVRVHRQQ